ncbi:hypothetical protein [Pseudomarimonas arenosa]|uniref:Uncharacterized protein n=1 Tax=Pseudomarimonas arenosa TaxID=2774145 RepID=A0AAW3ZRG1_9GAMM|nr:hypothetical protein [Pseudomarimonas arenosa]MBD8528049.1 hypothetical protein [Pseudomarimonas arenosa]
MSIALQSVLFLTLISASFSAQSSAHASEQREHRQQSRVAQGVANGELTRRETVRLWHGQRLVDAKQRRARADGVVTARERIWIHQEQNQQSRRIARQKHDDQRR